MHYETEVGAVLLLVAGFFFYVTLETAHVGAVLVAVGAWALILPRFLGWGGPETR